MRMREALLAHVGRTVAAMGDAHAALVVETLWSEVFGPATRIRETIEESVPHISDAPDAGEVDTTAPSCNESSWARHAVQTRAIALRVAAGGLLDTPRAGILTTIEFGAAADATLSEQVRIAAGAQVSTRQILIDRDATNASTHGRAPSDVDEGVTGADEGRGGSWGRERLTSDIAELDLPAVIGATASTDVVAGIAKHLCGPAFDAALRAMVSVAATHRGQLGVAMVGCCYGGCDWNSCCRATQGFFSSHGVGEDSFQTVCKAAGSMATILRRMTAAAAAAAAEVAMVLGVTDTASIALQADRAAAVAIAEAIDTALLAQPHRATGRDSPLDATTARRSIDNLCDPALAEIAGIGLAAARAIALSEASALQVSLQARRLLDEGRRRALECAGFQAKLLSEVVPHAISVENTLLLALRPPTFENSVD